MNILKLTDKFKAGKHKGKTPSVVVNKGESKYLNYFLRFNKEYRLHKDVIKHAQSKTQLNMNKTMIEVLEYINSKLSKKLLYLNKRKRLKSIFTNIKAHKSKKETITFDIPFGNKKNEIKVGRFVRKIFELNKVNGFTERDIELFVSSFYSNVGSPLLKDAYFKVVSGEKIREYYLEDNYHSRSGSLIRSCARYDYYQNKLDFYVYNPEQIQMLVMLDKETKKVKGRAIIWRNSKFIDYGGNVSDCVFMDRIYTNNDKDISLFKAWATKQGYIYKWKQSYSNKTEFIINRERKTGYVFSEVDKTDVNRPYFDTMVDGCLFGVDTKKFIGNSYDGVDMMRNSIGAT